MATVDQAVACERRSLLKSSVLYETATPLGEVDADTLTPRAFRREYVSRMRPVLVRGAARHWPACRLWRSADHLRRRIGNPTVRVFTTPLAEYLRGPAHVHPDLSTKDLQRQWPMSFDQFLTSTEHPYLMMRYMALDGRTPLAPLAADVGSFQFLGDVSLPRTFVRKRALLYRNSYTDFHYHEIDETLMSQVVGTKEVVLVPPDAESFAVLTEIGDSAGHLYDIDVARFPRIRNVRAYRAVVRPGDALYLPTFWWHAVESIPEEFGITVPWCWASPSYLFDIRLPGARTVFKRHRGTKYVFIAAGAAAWSIIHGAVTGRLWRSPYTA
jgi:hypothetical protein